MISKPCWQALIWTCSYMGDVSFAGVYAVIALGHRDVAVVEEK